MVDNQKVNELAVFDGAKSLIVGNAAFKIKTWVTRSVLKQEHGKPFYIKIERPIYLSTMDPENSEFKDANGNGVVPEIIDVVNLETGELQVVIANTVLGSELRRSYPDDSYVGKLFGVQALKPGRGNHGTDKRYAMYKIIELELDETARGGATARQEIDATGPDAIERVKAGKHSKAA
jgi:hypothetical protein